MWERFYSNKKTFVVQAGPGRPKGRKNKLTQDMKERIQRLADQLEEGIVEDIEALDPKERVNLYTNLLEYLTPKLQRVESQVEAQVFTPPKIKWNDEDQEP